MTSSSQGIEVAVIVPVLNAAATLEKLLDSLIIQDLPRETIEIIVVDNGSTDETRAIAGRYPVKVIEERSVRSSYAARNRGIAASKAPVLAFTDGDCVAAPNWLSKGLERLRADELGLVAGRTKFYFSEACATAELYDAATFLRTDVSSNEFQTSCTCNLFVRADVFEKVGMFPARVASMGDYQWTKRATAQGNRLVYEPDALVFHPARTLLPLLKKCARTGTGQPYVWLSEGRPMTTVFGLIFSVIKRPLEVSRTKSDSENLLARRPLRHALVAALCKACSLAGIVYSICKVQLGNRDANGERVP